MVTEDEYNNALDVIRKYKLQDSETPHVGDKYMYNSYYQKTMKGIRTVGKTYIIEKVKPKYKCYRIAVAIRDNKGILRWHSFDVINKYWKKEQVAHGGDGKNSICSVYPLFEGGILIT